MFKLKNVPKEWQYISVFLIAVLAYFYIKHKKQIELEDAAQLVIGAPGPGQVSITNPNPVRRAPVKVARPVTRLGGGSAPVRTTPTTAVKAIARPKCKPGFRSVKGLHGPVCVRITTPQTAPPNTNAPINQAFQNFGKTYIDTLNQQHEEVIHAATHPGTIRLLDPEGHVDPHHITEQVKAMLIEGTRVAGVP